VLGSDKQRFSICMKINAVEQNPTKSIHSRHINHAFQIVIFWLLKRKRWINKLASKQQQSRQWKFGDKV